METEKNPKFTVIITAYNLEKLIGTAINSVLDQTYKNYEIIVIDDCSTDNTLSVLKRYERKYPEKVRIMANEVNSGPSVSRNNAVEAARGEYIVYLDGDDTLYNKKSLEKVNEVLGEDGADIVYLGVQYIGGSNKAYIPNAENSTREARIVCDMHFPVASKVWRRQFLIEKDIKFIGGLYYEDMVYSIKAAIMADTLKYGEFPIYIYYRNREGSIMSTPTFKRCTDMYLVMYHLMDLYEKTPKHLQPYLLSFIKNETLSLPMRLDGILKAMEDKSFSPVIPKRNYVFTESTPTVVDGVTEEGEKPKLIPLSGGQTNDQYININTEIPMTAAADSITSKKGIDIKFNN